MCICLSGRQLAFARKALAFWAAVPGRAHCHALPPMDQEERGEGAAELDALTEADALARLQELARRRWQVRCSVPKLDKGSRFGAEQRWMR